MKIKVSERALVARINRALSADDMAIRKNRPNPTQPELGQWYTMHKQMGPKELNVNLEEFARRLDCLKDYEEYIPE